MGLESASTPTKASNDKLHFDVEAGIPQEGNSPTLAEAHKDSASLGSKDELHNRLRVTEKSDIITPEDTKDSHRDRSTKWSRFAFAMFGVSLMIAGRIGVPEIDVPCVQDRVLDLLQFANDFILKAGNEIFRDGFQILCSMIVDVTCLITFIHWIRTGNSYRLPMSLVLFYAIRAIVQNMFISPFTKGYYWESPGLPSLVVPYGRGSDFFFSGHTGFMVVCSLEWHYIGMKKVRNFVIAGAAYTMLILMVYQIHYSIDVFVGALVGEWCFVKTDKYCYDAADFFLNIYNKFYYCVKGKYKAAYKGM